MGWGKISKLMESEMNICLLIWLVDWVTVLSDCLFESKSDNLLDSVTVCLTTWLSEEWKALCLTVWLFDWLFFSFVCMFIYVSSFLCVSVCLFVCIMLICYYLSYYLSDWYYICETVRLFWYCSWLFLDWLNIDWMNDCLFDCSREWLLLFNWVNTCMLDCFSYGLAEGGSVCLNVFFLIACLTKRQFVWLTE